jgi:hypothetical protein
MFVQGSLYTTIYPPPSAQEVKDFVWIGAEFNKVITLQVNGQMGFYSLRNTSAILERVISGPNSESVRPDTVIIDSL